MLPSSFGGIDSKASLLLLLLLLLVPSDPSVPSSVILLLSLSRALEYSSQFTLQMEEND